MNSQRAKGSAPPDLRVDTISLNQLQFVVTEVNDDAEIGERFAQTRDELERGERRRGEKNGVNVASADDAARGGKRDHASTG